MAANRVGRRLGRASPARPGAALSPEGSRTDRTPSPGIQRRQARVTVKYDRRELQRRLDTEKWIDGWLEELYRGQMQAKRQERMLLEHGHTIRKTYNNPMILTMKTFNFTLKEEDMPDEVNIDTLLEMGTDSERAKKLQSILETCHNNTEEFIRELLGKLRGLRTEHVLRRTSPGGRGDVEPGTEIREQV